MRFQSFSEYVQMREGLWLPDRPVTPGGSRINPFPATQGRLRKMKPKPVKSLTSTVPKMTPFKIKPTETSQITNISGLYSSSDRY